MRLKLHEDAIRSRKKTDSVKSDAAGTDEATSSDQPAEEDDEPHTEPADEGDEEDADSGYGSPAKSGVSTGKGKGLTKSKLKGLKGTKKKSVSSQDGDMDETSSYASKARTEMVHRVLEGLRDEAFELARDIGVESLTAPGGLRSFVEKMREVVFPCATEEARELFRAGQKHGVLSRQSGESMLSYVSRRRRWWKLLRTLDTTIVLSEPMRVELLLELSGLTRQEALVIKACAEDSKNFDAVSRVLVDHYSQVHLREGKTLGGSSKAPRSNFR